MSTEIDLTEYLNRGDDAGRLARELDQTRAVRNYYKAMVEAGLNVAAFPPIGQGVYNKDRAEGVDKVQSAMREAGDRFLSCPRGKN